MVEPNPEKTTFPQPSLSDSALPPRHHHPDPLYEEAPRLLNQILRMPPEYQAVLFALGGAEQDFHESTFFERFAAEHPRLGKASLGSIINTLVDHNMIGRADPYLSVTPLLRLVIHAQSYQAWPPEFERLTAWYHTLETTERQQLVALGGGPLNGANRSAGSTTSTPPMSPPMPVSFQEQLVQRGLCHADGAVATRLRLFLVSLLQRQIPGFNGAQGTQWHPW